MDRVKTNRVAQQSRVNGLDQRNNPGVQSCRSMIMSMSRRAFRFHRVHDSRVIAISLFRIRSSAHTTRAIGSSVDWTREGDTLNGELPMELNGRHFGPELICFILYQYHHCQTTQPLLLEQLREDGIDISSAQIEWILSQRT